MTGKGAGNDPSLMGHDVSDNFDESLPGPDLELGSSTPGVPIASGSEPLGQSAFSDDWDEGGGESPAAPLDIEDPRAKPVAAASAEGTSLGPNARAKQAEAPAIEIDAYEVKALADFGPAPTSIVQTVPYAIRVVRRQRELRRALDELRKGVADAEARRDQRFIELGELLSPLVTADPQYRTLAEPLGRAEALARDRKGALAETDATFRERAAAIDAEIAALDPPRVQAQAAVEAQEKVFGEADRLAQKHEARRKRVEIDVRAAKTKLERPETERPERAAAQAVIAAADSERATRAAEEKIARDAAHAEESRLAQARRALAEIDGQIEHHRTRRRNLEADFTRQAGVRKEGVDAAHKEIRGALLEIGKRAAAEGGPAVDGVDLRRKGILDAEAQLKRIQLDHEKHLRALGSADRVAVRNGLIILVATVVLVVGSFVVWRLTRTNPYLEGVKTSQQVVDAPPCPST